MKRTFLCLAAALTTFTAAAQSTPSTLKVMSYNIRNGIGMDDSTSYERVARVIAEQAPDVCALQEVDSVTGRSGGRDVLREIASACGMHATYAKAIDFMGGAYGVGLLSKEQPVSVRRIPLPGREEARVALVAEFPEYYIIATHLTLTREDQFTSVRMLDSLAARLDKPVFLAGDLNFRPRSEQCKALGESFTLMTDSTKMTFPADRPRGCIDYIWAYKNPQWSFQSIHSEVVPASVESDHRPVTATIRYSGLFRTSPYLQNPTDGGMTVCWLTNVPAYSWVEYGSDPDNLSMARTLVDGQAIAGNTLNKIRLEGLEAGKKYYYRVHSRELTYYGAYEKRFGIEQTSPLYSFTLPAPGTKDFTAVIFNDLHQRRETTDALCKVVENIPYDFVVFNGDCIDDPHSQAQAVGSLAYYVEKSGLQQVPFFFLRGNHEIRGSYSVGLRELFDYVGDKTYGAFSWGDTRFVILDCGEDKPDDHPVYYGFNDFTGLRQDQVGFLQSELASPAFKKAGKRVLIHHIPIYGMREESYNPCLELWHPVLRKAPFDVALNGHTHRYAYVPKGEEENNFPVVIGGGFRMDGATVMVLRRKGAEMTLTVYDAQGAEKLRLDL